MQNFKAQGVQNEKERCIFAAVVQTGQEPSACASGSWVKILVMEKKINNDGYFGFDYDPSFGLNSIVTETICVGCVFFQQKNIEEPCSLFGDNMDAFILYSDSGSCPFRKSK